MGHRAAHLVGGGILDWFEVDEDFALVETMVPKEMEGQSSASSPSGPVTR